MTELDAKFNALYVSLIALLPKDGTPLTVAELVQATGAAQTNVIGVLMGPYMEGRIGFCVKTDSYFATTDANHLPTKRKQNDPSQT